MNIKIALSGERKIMLFTFTTLNSRWNSGWNAENALKWIQSESLITVKVNILFIGLNREIMCNTYAVREILVAMSLLAVSDN
jgi:hypothetical protein